MQPLFPEVKEGTLLNVKARGVCTVVSRYRAGHQYERFYRYDILTPSGSIIQIDEYDFSRGIVKRIIEEDKNV